MRADGKSSGPDAAPERKAGLRFLRSAFLLVCILVVLPLTIVLYKFSVVVPPNAIGVRVNYFSFGFLRQGYGNVGLDPGLHFRLPGISEIVLLPRTFLMIHFNAESQGGDLELPTLQVQSRNGPWVNTDASWVIRLNDRFIEGDKTHGGPADLITYFGFDQAGQLSKFARIAQNELSKALNELDSSDFYNPALREGTSEKATERLREIVGPYGVEVWRTLIRRYQYQKEEIDNQIFAKNLQTQTARLRVAQTGLAEVTAAIARVTESWTQRIREKEVEGQSYLLRKEADANFIEETKIAEGQRILTTKTAEVTSQKNKLLTDLAGSDVYVARDMVPLVRSIRGGIVKDVNPYDIERWVERFSGPKRGGDSPPREQSGVSTRSDAGGAQ